MLDHVINLLAQSDTHRSWTIDQVNRIIVPPVNLKQCCGIVEEGQLVAWCSWAWMDREKGDKFLDGCYSLKPEDWRCGTALVFADFVAPFGGTRSLYRMCRNLFPDYPKAEWRRHRKLKRVGVNVNVG